jgi:hypothetical protein
MSFAGRAVDLLAEKVGVAEPDLAGFDRDACGFRPTPAGLRSA